MRFPYVRAPYSFMGYQRSFEESDIVVVPVPYDSTTSYGGGTRNGPHALITASRQVETYDLETKKEITEEVNIHTMYEVEPDTDSPKGTIKRVEEAVDEILENKKFPVILGGEHSISLGPVLSLKKKYKKLSVLQIDAHGDLRDSYENSKYNHACVMRRIRENVDTCVQVGIRAISKDDAEYIKKKKIDEFMYYGDEFDTDKIVKQLSDEVYVSIDLDGFDPSEVPGVGTPEPGGLKWKETLKLLRKVAEKKKIVGFDVMELAPIPGNILSDFFAAKLTYKMLNYIFK